MGRWRVGTLSMGVSMIVLGLVLLISLMGGYTVADQLMTIWPIILVMIGGEVLLLIFRSKEETKIKYDVFSMIMIFLIFVVSMGVYSLTSTGLLKHLSAAVNSREYTVMIPQDSVKLKESIKKVIINPPNYASIELLGSADNQVVYRGSSEVFASSSALAEDLIKEGKVYFEEVGDVLYIQFGSLERRNDIRQGISSLKYSIHIPAGVDLEVKGSNYQYNSKVVIDGDAVKGNWLINESNRVQVKGSEQSDFVLEAVTESYHNLTGNIDWEIEQKDENRLITGKIILRDGKYRLNIVRSNVEILIIP